MKMMRSKDVEDDKGGYKWLFHFKQIAAVFSCLGANEWLREVQSDFCYLGLDSNETAGKPFMYECCRHYLYPWIQNPYLLTEYVLKVINCGRDTG